MYLSIVMGITLHGGRKMRVCGHYQDGLDVCSECCSYLDTKGKALKCLKEGVWMSVHRDLFDGTHCVLLINVPVSLGALSPIVIFLLIFSLLLSQCVPSKLLVWDHYILRWVDWVVVGITQSGHSLCLTTVINLRYPGLSKSLHDILWS